VRTDFAIVFAGVVIAATIALMGRWQIAAAKDEVYRLDRWTGEIQVCGPTMDPKATTERLQKDGVMPAECSEPPNLRPH